MNRIYQVVWSKAKNCYTVVSEIAKRHGKGNRARTCAAAFLAALALTSVMGMSEAQAQTIDADGISNGDARIALNGAAGMVGMVNGKDASIFMYGGNTTINKKVTIDQTGKIIGVAAGAVTAGSTDAVNGGQLHAVAAEASKHSKVVNGSNINVEESEVNGQKIYKVGLNDDVRLGMIETTGSITTKDSISAANGAQLADINVSGNVISNGKAAIALYGDSGIAGMKNGKGASIYMQDGHTSINEKVNIDQNGKITGVAAGAVTAGSTDAVNGSQLHAVATEAGKHSKVVNGSNINVEESEVNGQKIYKVGLNDDVRLGTIETTGYIATKDRISADKGAQLADINVSGTIISNGAAKIALNDSLGMAAMVNGKGASIYMQDGNTIINSKVAIDKDGKITGVAAGAVTAGSTDAVNGGQLHAVAADVAQNKADIAQNKADIAQNKADIAQNKADIAQNKADIAQNKTDIAQNKADIAQNKADIGKLDNRVTNVENLAKQHTTVEAGNNITVTESTNTDGGKKYTVGMAKDITVDSVKVGDKTYVSKDGLNANNQTITNVKDGKIEEGSKDAVNGGQLYATNQLVKDNASNISLLGNSINKLDNRVDKVGAGAAALAALHPLDFDPEDKWDFAAGYGNYSGASAVALGAYYRPNEDTMFSVGGSFGNGENMVNAGVSLKLGQSNRAPASKAAMEKKISALSQEVEELKAAIADLRAAQTKAKDATAKDAQKK